MNQMALLLAAALLASAARAAESQPPHIIFFMIDDLGFNDLGFQDSKRSNLSAYSNTTNSIISPRIDELAHTGVVLDDYAVYKYCSVRPRFCLTRARCLRIAP